MAVKRRKSVSTSRKRSQSSYDPPPKRVSVRFVGTEIDKAIVRIRKRAKPLPSNGQVAARRAIAALLHCRKRIQMAICDGWGAKG